MNIRTSHQSPRIQQTQSRLAPQQENGPAEGQQEDKSDINWDSMGRTGGIAAAFAAVPAAAALIGNATGHSYLGPIAAIGGAVTAFALRPKEGSLLVGTMMSTLGVHGANSFGIAGALGATVFVAAIGATADYQAQKQGASVF